MLKNGHPRFVTAGPMGTAMQLAPPFDFDGVTLRVFPLRANIYRLQRFIDGYLNLVPPQVARFRVPLPYAFMSLINYGKMAVDAANMGWIAQREILFCVPLEWYRLEKGKYVFQGWAFVSPFIYVDNELSMSTGRNVYGWPKSIAVLDAELNAWMENPRARSRLATASTMVFPEVYEGRRQEQRVFLEVMQSLGPSPLQVPPDIGGAAMPWVVVPNAVRSSASLLRDYVALFGSMGLIERQPYVGPAAYAAMARQIGRDMNPFTPGIAFNTMNLKQFRSADRPEAVAYQALTNARMEMKAYKNGGLMGDGNMLLGDSSGGFRVLVHRYKATPIVESLGLEVDSEWQGNGVNVASLKPVFPYWLDVDMRYNRGETLAWRTKVTDGWKVGAGDSAKHYVCDAEREPGPIRNPYNTSTAGAAQEIGGALTYPDTTFCVLPLMANPECLRTLLDGYLNEPLASEGMRFEPWGRYVYLVVANHSGVSSDTNNIGSWSDHEVKIHVAVKWYERNEQGEGRLRGVALVPIFGYANSTTATITSTEVTGIPVMKALVECPNGTWLDASGPGEATTDPLLRMTTTVLPVLNEGQGAQVRVVLEIKEGSIPGLDDESEWRRVSEAWGNELKNDLKTTWKVCAENPTAFDDALTLPLEVFGHGLPLHILTLKQFRETGEPSAACYQSLVLHRWGIDQVHDVREIETRLYACIHEYPTQPIVQTLGLVSKFVTNEGGARAHYVEPVRPFWFRQSQRQSLGLTIRRRAGGEAWEKDADTEAELKKHVPYFFGQPCVEEGLGERVYPRRIKAQVTGKIETGIAPGTSPERADEEAPKRQTLSAERALRAVETMEPQMILGAMLSREWENWGKPRWERARTALENELKAAEDDALPEEAAGAQVMLLLQKVKQRNAADNDPTASRDAGWQKRDQLAVSLQRLADTLTQFSEQRKQAVTERQTLRPHPPTLRPLRPDAEAVADLDPVQVEMFTDLLLVVSHDELYRSLRRVLRRLPREPRSDAETEQSAKRFEQLGAEFGRLFEARGKTEPTRKGAIDDRLGRLVKLLPLIQGLSESAQRRLRSKVVEDVKGAYKRSLSRLVHELSLSAQKPDHCVRRNTLEGVEAGRTFPDDQCWHDGTEAWFVGPRRVAVRPVLEQRAEAGTVTVPSSDVFDDWLEAKYLGSIRRVTIWAGDVVDAVQVGYQFQSLGRHGGDGGTRHEVFLKPDEVLVGLGGAHGDYFGAIHLCGVTLEVRGADGKTRTEGPFGDGKFVKSKVSFEVKAPKGQEIAALAGGSYLHTDGTEYLTVLAATIGEPVTAG